MHPGTEIPFAATGTPPAYSTYPKPDWFVEAFDASVLNAWLAAPRAPHAHGAIAIELRLPASSADGCLCGRGDCVSDDACFDRLDHEMALYRAALGDAPEVCDLRWSNGCATLPRKAMRRLYRAVAGHFGIPSGAGFGARLDPHAHHRDALVTLRKLGAHSIQIGAEPVDRHIKPDSTRSSERASALIASARDGGFTGIEAEYRIDAPERLGASPRASLDTLIAAGPTRLVLSDATPLNGSLVAHPPQLGAPAAFVNAAARLAHAGYVCIGENLFALASDPYAVAHRQGRLMCRAGGFATHPAGTVLGLGPGAIGQVGPFYYQNHRAPARYFAALDAGHLPIERGLHLSHDDLVRRSVISSLATNLFVDVPAIEAAYGIDFGQVFATEWRQLRAYAEGGLLTMDHNGITLTQPGRLACSSICQVFDAHARRRIERMPQTSLL
ncbi:hypothetical protein FAZ95_12320 [Trinickia violacea]|uniref:HemN C-terminal domain-containing protein n=1 Tax=Trinickia violacea TaxID=2571746 RepID=A0A4V1EHD5_9BURK|nr:hypothetical protein [Trinickia violacea]QCP49890.1 hypothetical protein FAZ95_12320 [Trinickia violacea]